jgi:YfiH family protein
MPVMICDPVRRAVATVHAGWRGTVSDVAGETVRMMSAQFGSEPADLVAYLGPAIGACCYEVGEDVFAAWIERAGDIASESLRTAGDRWMFDLAAANRWSLLSAGVQPNRIDGSGICTRCEGDEWFSHRGQGPATGRYGAFIALTES